MIYDKYYSHIVLYLAMSKINILLGTPKLGELLVLYLLLTDPSKLTKPN